MIISNFTNNYVMQVLFITIAIIVIGCTIIVIANVLKHDIEVQKESNKEMKKLSEELERYNDIRALDLLKDVNN